MTFVYNIWVRGSQINRRLGLGSTRLPSNMWVYRHGDLVRDRRYRNLPSCFYCCHSLVHSMHSARAAQHVTPRTYIRMYIRYSIITDGGWRVSSPLTYALQRFYSYIHADSINARRYRRFILQHRYPTHPHTPDNVTNYFQTCPKLSYALTSITHWITFTHTQRIGQKKKFKKQQN